MRGLALHEKMITGRAFNDTKYQRYHGRADDVTQRMHATVEQSLLKPQLFPNRAPQKVAFFL